MGTKAGVEVLRKHRLWETFLYQKLGFTWDEVHQVAEQLEHIQSQKLIDSLDKFLDYPEFDPHGDVIPNASGEIKYQYRITLSEIDAGKKCKMVAVIDNSPTFLKYVIDLGVAIGSEIKVLSRIAYDNMLLIETNGKKASVSAKFSDNIYVICHDCIKGKSCKLNCKNF